MTHIERFIATIERRPVDHPASWLGIPSDKAIPELFKYFGVKDIKNLKALIDDDLYPVELPYNSPTSNAIYAAFNFSKESGNPDERTLTKPGFFEDYSDPTDIERFNWPEPEKYINPEQCRRSVENIPEGYATLGVVWSAHFQDALAAFGMETAMIKMITEPEMFRAVINRIVDFYLRANKIFYEATRGKLNAVLIGNDFGGQTGLMVSPDLLRDFVYDGTGKLIQQAKHYGLKVIHHSCGSIFDIIPDLIELGVDAIHPIQALATKMDPQSLKNAFGNQTAFCGGVDAQHLLVHGTPDDIKQKVSELKQIFPTGLIISPSHEAILPDIPPANIQALFNAIKN